jgi:UDP-N-acetylglucosamine diphosphorylase / glucose-1-phosphate thymidylyltransferase / UDP-N-acetylgalactosamine diphosphorylase / glucosamine-1-phosphate N-acetyltransferase / galactosamine-1-phosphate N-acetyltransferase
MNTRVVLFEDQFLEDMDPVALTRPAFAVTCGCGSLWDVVRGATGEVQWIVREHLRKVTARRLAGSPPFRGGVLDRPTLFLNASILPDSGYAEHIRAHAEEESPFVCTANHRISAALVPAGTSVPDPLQAEQVTPWLLELKLPLAEEETFKMLDHQFEVVKHHEELFAAGLASRLRAGGFREVRPGVHAADGVTIADSAVFHVKGGPVVLDQEVTVGDFAYFEGPVYVGPRTRLIERASLKEAVCVGAVCKVGGEIEKSVIEPYTNKQHHGFLGHSWVGSWVNLGAGTSCSDLKNTYGEVHLDYPHRRVDTGMQFLGCIVGDYAKSAINTSIFTGKLVGVGSMLYGFVGSNVPSFCNYARSFGQITECPFDQAALIQKRMFARRGIAQTADDVECLRAVFDRTRDERLLSDEPPSL